MALGWTALLRVLPLVPLCLRMLFTLWMLILGAPLLRKRRCWRYQHDTNPHRQ